MWPDPEVPSEEPRQDRAHDRTHGRLEVVRREDHYDFSRHMHTEEHSWAVSYADLLMVLLSFFVIFFSVNGQNGKQELIFKIVKNMKGQASGVESVRGGTGTGTGYGGTSATGGPQKGNATFDEKEAENIATLFGSLSPRIQNDPLSVSLVFPDDLFDPGQYVLKGPGRTQFESVISQLNSYGEDILLVVTGHADSRLVPAHRRFQDNFELSSLRALAALRVAAKLGFPEKNIRVRAASSNERDARSISITIQNHK